MKDKNITKYPKINGKQWDEIRKSEFDYWIKEFTNCIDMSNIGETLSDKEIETVAWNMAYLVVTDRH